jgi:hypothetical protein
MRVLAFALALAVVPLASPSAAGQESCPLNFTATPHADGSVSFHWSGFGGADGYQVFGHADMANTAGYSPFLNGDARDFTATNIASGNYTFWVVAFHSGTVVAKSCERTVTVPAPGGQVPFFPSVASMVLAGAGAIAAALLMVRRRA